MPVQTSPEAPMPVRTLAMNVASWIDRLGAIWIEGQVAQLRSRAGTNVVWITLRDPLADVSVTVTAKRQIFDIVDPPVVEGAKIVVNAKAEYYLTRGSLSFAAREIRPVGLGDLLARLERLKRLLAAEGLFAADRKRTLPFLPRRVGLICGRDSAAEHDVLTNARARWPAVEFAVRNVPVQGIQAVQHILLSLRELERDPDVDVIVITRGGGSLEDLLPFSDEALLRAVAEARTPVVSAIGHETDSPLLDLVADVRASTPTDAARVLVPDVAEELAGVVLTVERMRSSIGRLLASERAALLEIRRRPVLADPHALLRSRDEEVATLLGRVRQTFGYLLRRSTDDIEQHTARVRALSPLATLKRGYAVVQDAGGTAVRTVEQLDDGDRVRVWVADGRFDAEVAGSPSKLARDHPGNKQEET
jgi:exodeoxyribonuclease VII large subunit